MKITSILIENFKSITNINISNLPNFVVIVGENGVGKTSIFDAIGFLKSFVGPYSPQDTTMTQQKMRQQNPIRVGATQMKIAIEIEPTTDEERNITNNNNAIAEVQVTFDGTNYTPRRKDKNNAAELLQLWRSQQESSAVEIIPANRVFSEGELQLQSSRPNIEQELIQRTSQIQNKYNDSKQKFVGFLLHDKLIPDEPEIFPDLQNLIVALLGKQIRIVFDSKTRQPKIEVEAIGGFVDVDTLSSGQRELFMTYVGIYVQKFYNSIILFDEPDLHLHASLQKQVLGYLRKLTSGNQIFLATHALEMISETPEKNLFHLSPFSTGSQLKSLVDEKDKVEIFKKLGASKYTFVNFKKVVFLEGRSDRDIIHSACPIELGLRFEVIDGISKATPGILDEASQVESFFMINDRDFLSDSQISAKESQYHDKIKYLKRRHIENYILDSDEFYEIYEKSGTGTYTSKDDFIAHLLDISKKQLEQTVTDCFLARYPGNTYPPKIVVKNSQSSEDALNDAFTTTETRLKTHITDIPSKVSTIRSELQSDWDNTWLQYASGKNILSEVGKHDFSQGKTMENIRELVSVKWDEKQLPQELLDILKKISQS